MSDELALLTAIIANPDEDTPRLVFADWLQENGQPERAEFIRVQIELTRLPDRERQTPHYRALLIRFRELIALHRDGWVKPLGVPPTRAIFRRGFVEEIRLNSDELLAIGDAVLCREVLSSVEVYPPPDDDADEDTAEPPGDAVLRRLAAWPGRGRLRVLRAERFVLTPSTFEAFVNAPPAAGLQSLDIATCQFPPQVIRALAASANLTELTELRLGHRELAADDVLSLARAPYLKKLQTVILHITGENDPDAPDDLREACRELRRRYPHVWTW
jgi:uncharacterized protein (TIGR02996 family)